MAADSGADALIVSNHGGRQLDGARSSISALPGIVAAVGDRIEVHMDGGVRSGQDVLKAVALGAKAAWIGRPFLYGLGAGGRAGVTRALEIIQRELDVTMALCGKPRHPRRRRRHPRHGGRLAVRIGRARRACGARAGPGLRQRPGGASAGPAQEVRRSGGTASAASSAATASRPATRLALSPRRRSETVRSSTSRWPTARITGTLARLCSRTL